MIAAFCLVLGIASAYSGRDISANIYFSAALVIVARSHTDRRLDAMIGIISAAIAAWLIGEPNFRAPSGW